MLEVKKICSKNAAYSIKWKIVDICNFHCPYCYQGRGESELKNYVKYSKDVVAQSVENLNYVLSKLDQKVELHLTGGEPTLIDLENEVFRKLDLSKIKKVFVATNFSAPNEKLKSFRDFLKENGIETNFMASVHLSERNFEEFFEKVKDFDDVEHVSSVFVIGKDNYEKSMECMERMFSAGYRVKPVVMRDTKLEKLTKEQVQSIEKYRTLSNQKQMKYYAVTEDDKQTYVGQTNQLLGFFDNRLAKTTGWVCKFNCLMIEPNGTFRYGHCSKEPFDLDDPEKTVICKSKQCVFCYPATIYNPKYL